MAEILEKKTAAPKLRLTIRIKNSITYINQTTPDLTFSRNYMAVMEYVHTMQLQINLTIDEENENHSDYY